ncbi:peptidoglycan editing factor PgeF [Candidatus Omnitrophota bacterium]
MFQQRNLNLSCGFSIRQDGDMSLACGNRDVSLENRRRFLDPLGVSCQSLICAKQIHSSNIRRVGPEDKGRGGKSFDNSLIDTDGFITAEKGLALAVFTADCLPIFFYDQSTPAIGLIHAGWRGTGEGIAAKAVKLLQDNFDSKPKDLRVTFGPCIGLCCYEVGLDFSKKFDYGFEERDGRYYLDLAGINKKQLLDAGVKSSNIFDDGGCTACKNNEFFSFRREGDSAGRMISVIMLK